MIQMHDQTKRMDMLDTRKETADILMKLLIVFFIFAVMATAYTIFCIKEAEASNYKAKDDLACIVSDNLITDDMQEFIGLYGNGEMFDEGDLE